MDNKLQELTQRLYDEGLQKGREQGESIVEAAKAEAAQILEAAKLEAARILEAAENSAQDTAKNSLTEITLAGRQALSRIKSELSGAIVSKTIEGGVKAAAMDAKFISEMLLAVAKNWNGNSGGQVSLEALLPAAEKTKLEAAMKSSAAALLKSGIEIGYSESVKTGFKVGEKDGGYYISFSDSDFDALMRNYLREKVAQLLF